MYTVRDTPPPQKQEKKQAALGIRKISFKPPPRPLCAIKKEREIKFCQFYIKGKCNKVCEISPMYSRISVYFIDLYGQKVKVI